MSTSAIFAEVIFLLGARVVSGVEGTLLFWGICVRLLVLLKHADLRLGGNSGAG